MSQYTWVCCDQRQGAGPSRRTRRGRWARGRGVGVRRGRWGTGKGTGLVGRAAGGARRQRATGARAGTAWARKGARLGARSAWGTTGWAARACGRCAEAGPVGCSCTRLGFQPVFFDTVFFLSHQMNTVHCKIKFEKKIF